MHSLMLAVASAETSINGYFYRHLPAASIICGPEPQRDARWALGHMAQFRVGAEDEACAHQHCWTRWVEGPRGGDPTGGDPTGGGPQGWAPIALPPDSLRDCRADGCGDRMTWDA